MQTAFNYRIRRKLKRRKNITIAITAFELHFFDELQVRMCERHIASFLGTMEHDVAIIEYVKLKRGRTD